MTDGFARQVREKRGQTKMMGKIRGQWRELIGKQKVTKPVSGGRAGG